MLFVDDIVLINVIETKFDPIGETETKKRNVNFRVSDS